MATISFAKNRPPIQVTLGDNLMQALLKNGLPVASSCNGEGVCSKCGVKVLKGEENLSSANDTELFLREKNQLPPHTRVSCQTHIFGDVTLDTGYW